MGEVMEAGGGEAGIPQRAVLRGEGEEVTAVIGAGGEAGGLQIEERGEGVDGGALGGGVAGEERDEADGLVAEVFAEKAVAGGGRVAFVEHEVEHAADVGEARSEAGVEGNFK